MQHANLVVPPEWLSAQSRSVCRRARHLTVATISVITAVWGCYGQLRAAQCVAAKAAHAHHFCFGMPDEYVPDQSIVPVQIQLLI